MVMVRNRAAAVRSLAASRPAPGICAPSSTRCGHRRRDPCVRRLPGRAAAGRLARIRSRRGWLRATGSASGSTCQSASPVMPSGSRLVARIRSRRHSPSTRSANAAADSITCSQLSRISSASRSRIAAMSPSTGSALGVAPSRASRSPSAASVAWTTSPSAPMAASSTSQTPLAGRRAACARSPWPAWSYPSRPARSGWSADAPRSARGPRPHRPPGRRSSSARPARWSSCSPLAAPARPAAARRARRTTPARGRRPAWSARVSLVRSYASSASVSRPAAARARISAATSRSRIRMGGHQIGQLRDQLGAMTETYLRIEPILQRGQSQPFEPGDRSVQRFALFQADILPWPHHATRRGLRATAVPAVNPLRR